MELINRTPVVAQIRVSTLEGTPHRYGMLTAKATFMVGEDQCTRLDTQDPVPLFDADEPTEFGAFPSDAVPRRDRALEVIVLGAAYGNGRSWQQVELAVGDHRRSVNVTGDRHWIGSGRGARISEAARFDAIPLTWERAYGGSVECRIDEHSIIELEHSMNRFGRGLDAARLAKDVGAAFKAPAGFPCLAPDYRRALPNIEHPQHLIVDWNDDPRPYCWATVPMDIGVHLQRAHDHFKARGEGLSQQEMLAQVYHRAHPDWILPIPSADAPVLLRGMTPGAPWSFRLPRLRVLADYEFGPRTGTRELEPHLLMLLPEQSRFYLVYRYFFTMPDVTPTTRRSFRLRLEKGWIE
ncbi:DUF2169 domain-containing protein [Nannocystis punicea]|uniref:DUF2169 domain-containing protein n=1 Tax=Nannocystis punicea TaxID=2995304 RepID=A0ABY7GXD2_9BACT|nr:DUF2169 domain-containing protein [Nannocystis poenicansa]WAS91535.1 DUF2169 domain-containing protein [Nannocystis poenicansa]